MPTKPRSNGLAALMGNLSGYGLRPNPTYGLTDILTTQLLHETGNQASPRWCEQQMDVVVHQHIGMQRASRGLQSLTQQSPVTTAIVIVEKTGQPVIAPLDDVLWHVGQIESGLAGHAPLWSMAARATIVIGRMVT